MSSSGGATGGGGGGQTSSTSPGNSSSAAAAASVAQCFVCNLPILSHHSGLKWQGGNGVDDLLREQMERVSRVTRA